MGKTTDELLNLLLWSADTVMRPTLRGALESYEGWAYRNGLIGQMVRLERRKLIERKSNSKKNRLYRLSARGRLQALGGRDPEERWGRKWDGYWRLVIFDVPIGRDAQRERLRRYLRSRDFGYLQNSVWITPDSLEREREILARDTVDVESLILLKAKACAGETDEEIVSGAWDFPRINRRYTRYLKLLGGRPTGSLRNAMAIKSFLRWATKEREAWFDAVRNDPLLPARILPPDYLGQRAWRRRSEVIDDASRQLRSVEASH